MSPQAFVGQISDVEANLQFWRRTLFEKLYKTYYLRLKRHNRG
jgi:hypothetical protein